MCDTVVSGTLIHDDVAVWSALYDFLIVSARPETPPTVAADQGVLDTPFSFGVGSVHNTNERRKHMDAVIFDEMKGSIYPDVEEFLPTFFHTIPGLLSLAKFQSTTYTANKK